MRKGKLKRIDDHVELNRNRLTELSKMRVDYETLRTDVLKKAEVKGKADEKLADIQSLASSTNEINMFTRVDEPQVDVNPAGPSKKLILLGGMLSGLFIGIGLVMLVAPTDNIASFVGSPTDTPPIDHDFVRSGINATTANSSPPMDTNPVRDTPTPIQSPVAAAPNYTPTPPAKPAPEVSNYGPAPTTAKVEPQVAGDTGKSGFAPPSPTSSSMPVTEKPTPNTLQRTSQKISDLPNDKSSVQASILEKLRDPNPTITKAKVGSSAPIQPESITRAHQIGAAGALPVTENLAVAENFAIAEKPRQLEKSELKPSVADQPQQQPIATNAMGVSTDKVAAPPNQPGTPLETSNQDLTASEFSPKRGTPSATTGGNKPDNRQAASTVNLDKLRKQLAARKAELGEATLHDTPQQPGAHPSTPAQLQPGQQADQTLVNPVSGAGLAAPMVLPSIQQLQSEARNVASGQQQQPTAAPKPSEPTTGTIVFPQNPSNFQMDASDSGVPKTSDEAVSNLLPGTGDVDDSKDGSDSESPSVDKHISDLADSIRDMCRPITTPMPDQTQLPNQTPLP